MKKVQEQNRKSIDTIIKLSLFCNGIFLGEKLGLSLILYASHHVKITGLKCIHVGSKLETVDVNPITIIMTMVITAPHSSF